MATQANIPNDELHPGDLVDVTYEIQPGATAGLMEGPAPSSDMAFVPLL